MKYYVTAIYYERADKDAEKILASQYFDEFEDAEEFACGNIKAYTQTVGGHDMSSKDVAAKMEIDGESRSFYIPVDANHTAAYIVTLTEKPNM